MDTEKAIEVLENLANGISPLDGEVFPYDSLYNHPLVIRAMFICLGAIRIPRRRKSLRHRQENNLAKGLPRNSGMPWSEELLMELVEQYSAAVQPPELAAKYERSQASIVAQLIRRGAMSAEEARQFYS